MPKDATGTIPVSLRNRHAATISFPTMEGVWKHQVARPTAAKRIHLHFYSMNESPFLVLLFEFFKLVIYEIGFVDQNLVEKMTPSRHFSSSMVYLTVLVSILI